MIPYNGRSDPVDIRCEMLRAPSSFARDNALRNCQCTRGSSCRSSRKVVPMIPSYVAVDMSKGGRYAKAVAFCERWLAGWPEPGKRRSSHPTPTPTLFCNTPGDLHCSTPAAPRSTNVSTKYWLEDLPQQSERSHADQRPYLRVQPRLSHPCVGGNARAADLEQEKL